MLQILTSTGTQKSLKNDLGEDLGWWGRSAVGVGLYNVDIDGDQENRRRQAHAQGAAE